MLLLMSQCRKQFPPLCGAARRKQNFLRTCIITKNFSVNLSVRLLQLPVCPLWYLWKPVVGKSLLRYLMNLHISYTAHNKYPWNE
ncbi:SSUH2 isoform 5 [Pan troglodytes]|uniref:SSUH2 isoform 5 n=1 Tax=Pan troglodytes TaxID=9598 RepID=A0A2J8M0N4_PANTR|nr:SSUH2 isoform 5 [Pan troglodytes]